ncbi:MAG: efflux RND transporter periplasmic adaptor subunit [Candidatus Anammoxibacter sp.]
MTFSKIKLIIILIVICAIGGIVLFFVNGEADDQSNKDVKYKEIEVKRGSFQIIVTANGVVKPINRIEIKSKASGQIEALPVEEGDFIQQGALIAKLDQKEERTEVAQAQAELDIAHAKLKQAKRAFERRDQLYRDNHISISELDEIELTLAVSRSELVKASTELDRAKERLSETIVSAPVAGIILQKYVEKGQIIVSGVSNVSGGTQIVDIADMSIVYIEAGIDEIDIGKVNVGQIATVKADAYPQLKFSGEIVRIAPEAKIEQNVTLFDVIVEVVNTDGKLKSGMNTDIEITIVKLEDVLLAPTMALQTPKEQDKQADEKNVFLKEGNDFVLHKVKTGFSNFKQTEILSGLTEDSILGMPITSRLKGQNERLQRMIKNSRSFGAKKGKKSKKSN